MNKIVHILFIITLSTCLVNCSSTRNLSFKSRIIYETNNLIVTQITNNAYTHISYKQTNDFGKVSCNGLIVKDNNEVIIFDTPTDNKSAEELIGLIKDSLHCKINAIIPTHFHDDCLGGLEIFENNKIPSYANANTIELAKINKLPVPENSFTDSLILEIGNKIVIVKFFGEGHTQDNVIGYFPSENIMFGGCLIKSLKANKGYLGDANVKEWSKTVAKVKTAYPNVQIVIPGHGRYGDKRLLDYTIKLFQDM